MRRFVIAFMAVTIAGLAAAPDKAAADPLPRLDAALRVSWATGVLEEETWAYPGVDLSGTLRFGPAQRGFVDVQLGYAPIDNHTYLADGRFARVAVVGGVRLLRRGALRLGGAFMVEKFAFHADPDVLAEHAGVDILASRTALVPGLGAEASYNITRRLAVGVFGRAGLSKITFYREGDVDPQAAGAEGSARLVLFGLFAEIGLR